ncbi:hypothetical protein EDF61_11014 [Arthrobacter sp. JUb115]|nr:hypothetical protein EDF61_11014 [Arthrobacter sp. JUb115]
MLNEGHAMIEVIKELQNHRGYLVPLDQPIRIREKR